MSKKQGLHGIKAFLVVVGSGVAAGLLFVGIISYFVKSFVSVASGGFKGSDDGIVAPTRSPRETTAPGTLDVCGIGIESSGVLPNPIRVDEGLEPVDSATLGPGSQEEVRTVEDECQWEFVEGGYGNFVLTFRYESVMEDSSEKSKVEISKDDFDAFKERVMGEFLNIESQGELRLSGVDGSYYFYGESGGGERYSLVGRVKSSVFELSIESTGENSLIEGGVPESVFLAEVRQLTPYIASDFERMVPD